MILYSLDKSYSSYITSLNQALRSNSSAFTLNSLIASLINEARRIRDIEESFSKKEKKAFLLKKAQKKQGLIKKVKKCKNCKKLSHLASNCFHLYPKKAGPNQVNKGKKASLNKVEKLYKKPDNYRSNSPRP